jgi:hypothetical protein
MSNLEYNLLHDFDPLAKWNDEHNYIGGEFEIEDDFTIISGGATQKPLKTIAQSSGKKKSVSKKTKKSPPKKTTSSEKKRSKEKKTSLTKKEVKKNETKPHSITSVVKNIPIKPKQVPLSSKETKTKSIITPVAKNIPISSHFPAKKTSHPASQNEVIFFFLSFKI